MAVWRRAVALALAVAIVTAGAPLAAARDGCAVCPPDCGMHRKHSERLPCHQAATSGTRPERRAGCDPGLRMPGCGRDAGVLGIALPPGLLAVPTRVSPLPPPPSPCAVADAATATRGADPPDTPPPIAIG
jgi:hypothetical protein